MGLRDIKPNTWMSIVKYMFIRDVVRQGLVRIKLIGTDHMVADILTKGLRRHSFEACRKGLGLMKGSVWDQIIKPGMSVSSDGDTTQLQSNEVDKSFIHVI